MAHCQHHVTAIATCTFVRIICTYVHKLCMYICIFVHKYLLILILNQSKPWWTMVSDGVPVPACACVRAWMCVRVCVCTCVHSSLLTDLFLLTLPSQLCLLRRGPPKDGTADLAECGHWYCSTVGQVSALLCVHTQTACQYDTAM